MKIVNDTPLILGHLNLDQIRDLFPMEISEQVKWQSLKVTVPLAMINENLC